MIYELLRQFISARNVSILVNCTSRSDDGSIRIWVMK